MKRIVLAALVAAGVGVIGAIAFMNLANQLDWWEQQQPIDVRSNGRVNPIRVLR